MGTENPLFLMSGDFKFYCLQFKNPVGILKILTLFPDIYFWESEFGVVFQWR